VDVRIEYDDELPVFELHWRDLSLETQLQPWQSHISTSITIMKKPELGQVEDVSL